MDSTPLEGREGREHRVRPQGPAPRTRAPGSPPASRRRGPAPPPRPRGQVWARRRLLSLFSLFLHSCGWKRLYSPKKRCPHLPGRSFCSKKKKGAEEDDCELELTSCCLRLGGPIPPPTPPTSFPADGGGGAACLPRRHRPSSRWAESGVSRRPWSLVQASERPASSAASAGPSRTLQDRRGDVRGVGSGRFRGNTAALPMNEKGSL